MLAYHFVGNNLRDGRNIPPDGEWLEHSGPLFLCESGLHASVDPFDALTFAPGSTLCLVEVDGDIVEGDDKLVCRRRKIIARIDAGPLLREFARWCALQVIDLWDSPKVVRDYLETGDEAIRAAARDAARTAAWSAAGEVALAAARAAAGAAADAARAAAWSAAGAARAVARTGAWSAARDAAGDARDAAWTAAREAAKDAQRAKFREMVNAAFA
ncbi:MAG: hypothetical protein IPJ41_17850 [Phycisphaerales bacterium]|nr:hypothetical protein [Phycisphaerales bacterium]